VRRSCFCFRGSVARIFDSHFLHQVTYPDERASSSARTTMQACARHAKANPQIRKSANPDRLIAPLFCQSSAQRTDRWEALASIRCSFCPVMGLAISSIPLPASVHRETLQPSNPSHREWSGIVMWSVPGSDASSCEPGEPRWRSRLCKAMPETLNPHGP
jgi:hypothetical protein